MADLPAFMRGCGAFFIAVTLAVAALKPEAAVAKEGDAARPEGIAATYASLAGVLRRPPVRRLAAVLFTWKLGFAVVDSVAPLKLQARHTSHLAHADLCSPL